MRSVRHVPLPRCSGVALGALVLLGLLAYTGALALLPWPARPQQQELQHHYHPPHDDKDEGAPPPPPPQAPYTPKSAGIPQISPAKLVPAQTEFFSLPEDILTSDPERTSVVSQLYKSIEDRFPMCTHGPDYARQECTHWTTYTESGRRFRSREVQGPRRASQLNHALCPKSAKDKVRVSVMGAFTNTALRYLDLNGECPVPCEGFVGEDRKFDNRTHIVLAASQDYALAPPPILNGQITLEYYWSPLHVHSREWLEKYDIVVSWMRDVADVYINYMYGWEDLCGHPKDWATSRCFRAPPTKEQLKRKRFAGAFISQCAQGRMRYMQELSQAVSELSKGTRKVENFGMCGRSADSGEAGGASPQERKMNTLAQFKFALSFENSVRADYLTEKVLESALSGALPVVWGGPEAHDYLPGGKGSYIHALDFASPRDLAKFLLDLDNDDEAYLSYFKWKQSDPVAMNPIFLNQMAYNALAPGKHSFVCRTCQVYLRQFCGRTDV